MPRVTIRDIARESGLSTATVDRAVNGRSGIHERTRIQVEQAIARLSAPPEQSTDMSPVDLALRIGRGLMRQMSALCSDAAGRELNIVDLYQQDDARVLEEVRRLCEDVDRPLIVAAKTSARLNAELTRARRRGKTIITMITDLEPEARDAFAGIDNRAAGQTAALLIGRILGDRHSTVGVIVGDPAYRCHEDREIGFRATLRSSFPKVVIAGEAVGQDDPERTYDALKRLITGNPAIAALYNVGGANLGVAQALRDWGRVEDMILFGHEANEVTVPLLQEGVMDAAIAQDPAALLALALQYVDSKKIGVPLQQTTIDFNVVTKFNVPRFARGNMLPDVADSELR